MALEIETKKKINEQKKSQRNRTNKQKKNNPKNKEG